MPAAFRLSGYVLLWSREANETSKVLVCVRQDIAHVRHALQPHNTNHYICLTLTLKGRVCSVIGAYIPPRDGLDKSYLFSTIQCCAAPRIIVGDFNAHHPQWGSAIMSNRGRDLADFMHTQDLVNINDGSPTFLRGTTYSSCLDVAFVSRNLHPSVSWCSDVETHGSDHIPTYICIKWFAPATSPRVQYTDWPAFRAAVETSSVDLQSPSQIEGLITSSLSENTRYVSVPVSVSSIDVEFERLRAIRRRAERKYRRTKSAQDLALSRRAKRQVLRHLERLGRQRWRQFCSSLDPRKPLSRIWHVARSLRTPPRERHPFRALALYQRRNEVDVAEDFCKMVVGTNQAQLPISEVFAPPSPNDQYDVPFTIAELDAALASCRHSSAPGPDGITYSTLSNLGKDGRTALLNYFNDIWASSTVPEHWKISRLVALLKPGKPPLELTSYRPVA